MLNNDMKYDKIVGVKSYNINSCPNCSIILTSEELRGNDMLCINCSYHFKMDSKARLDFIFDKYSITLFDEHMTSVDFLNFPNYNKKLEALEMEFGIKDAVTTGVGEIFGNKVCFGVMDYRFIMGTMGSVVGEKLTRMFEVACEKSLPVVIFTASGGARMQEGMVALYQMAKVIAAAEKHSQQGLLYITVLTNPTMGGVMASFASIADIIIAEPDTIVGLVGKRVTNNINEKEELEDFQSVKYHFENGHIDLISKRNELKKKLETILILHKSRPDKDNRFSRKNKIMKMRYINKEENNNLSVYDRVKFARKPYRPNYEDLIINIFDQFVEFHGDRISRDDPAVLTGMASVDGMNAIVVMTAKGKKMKDRMYRNFGMVGPEGYRKVIRVAMLGEKLKLPILMFVDTPGANYGIESERMGQLSEIAHSIKCFMNIRTPVISIITGEGGSGGALALGVADKIFIMENAIYSVISPEGCASILFNDGSKAAEVSEYMKITSEHLLNLKIVDGIIPEPPIFKFESSLDEYINNIKTYLLDGLIELLSSDMEELHKLRIKKFRNQGIYCE